MAGLRVFVSSTCYDLAIARAQLRLYIASLGHEPILSDFNDILYDPRHHTHTSCIDEVSGCDMAVLIVGSRFGGTAIPDALSKVDFEKLSTESSSIEFLKKKGSISVTQLEILKAFEQGIPVYSFIEDRVWHDHALYEKNKAKGIIKDIEFPSIQKSETASYIFEFINFLRHRTINNNVFPFSKVQDIEDTLRRQWSQLFQRTLNEQRHALQQRKQIDELKEQFENLQAAILSTVGSAQERNIARGVVRNRHLVEFIRGLLLPSLEFLFQDTPATWPQLLEQAKICEILDGRELKYQAGYPRRFSRCFLLRTDNKYYECRLPISFIEGRERDLIQFGEFSPESRRVIVDTLLEVAASQPPLRLIDEPFTELLDRLSAEEDSLRRHYFEADSQVDESTQAR